MKAHRSTQLFLYCSEGERSVQCICLALEMEASKGEQRHVIRFLVTDGVGTCKLHRRISAMYGEHYMSLTSVKEWQERFREGRTSLQDDSRPGQAHLARQSIHIWLNFAPAILCLYQTIFGFYLCVYVQLLS